MLLTDDDRFLRELARYHGRKMLEHLPREPKFNTLRVVAEATFSAIDEEIGLDPVEPPLLASEPLASVPMFAEGAAHDAAHANCECHQRGPSEYKPDDALARLDGQLRTVNPDVPAPSRGSTASFITVLEKTSKGEPLTPRETAMLRQATRQGNEELDASSNGWHEHVAVGVERNEDECGTAMARAFAFAGETDSDDVHGRGEC